MEIVTSLNLLKNPGSFMRDLIFVAIGFSLALTSCQPLMNLFKVDESKMGVKYGKSRGTIFNGNYAFPNFLMLELDSTKRWTPDADDIQLAERILRAGIKEANKNRLNQMNGCPIIHQHLNDYFRQYVGLINDQGHKVIHINMSWDKFTLKDRIAGNSDGRLGFESDYSITMDGCSYYWEVNIDLNEKKITSFGVNGVG